MRKPPRKSILIVESDRLSTMRKVIKEMASIDSNPISLTVLCSERSKKFYYSNSRVDSTLTYPAQGFINKATAAFKLIFKNKKFDTSVAVLNGRCHFLELKIFFWLIRTQNHLIFNGKLDSYLIGIKTIPKLFNNKRKTIVPHPRKIDTLLFETDDYRLLREVITITRGKQVVPGARITVFCRDSSAQLFRVNPFVDEVISYRDNSLFSWLSKSIKAISARNVVVVAVLSGKKNFFISKLLFWLSRNRHRLIFNGFLDCAFWNRHTYAKIIAQGLKSGVSSPFADNPRKVLILESGEPEVMKKLIKKAAEPRVNPNAVIALFCNEFRKETYNYLQEIDTFITYSGTSFWSKLGSSLKLIFSYPDVVVARFSGRRDFISLKLLFWLVRAPYRIVFNEKLDCFYLNRKTARLLLSVRHNPIPEDEKRIDTLLFETDDYRLLRKVIKITRGKNVVPGARITVFCRDSSAKLFRVNPFVDEVISYRDHSLFSWLSRSIKAISARNVVVVAVLSGKKNFFISKLLFWLSRNRHRLIFNGFLDCAFWNRHTYAKIIAQGLKSGVSSPFADNPRKVLILESGEPEVMKKLIKKAAEPRVNPNAVIALFCNEFRKETYNYLQEIDTFITYSGTSFWSKLGSSLKLIFSYPDVVVARFSGRRDFISLKLLFWLVRAPYRIVFNEKLDCFYLNRKTARLLLSVRHNPIPEEKKGIDTLLFETDDYRLLREVIKITRGKNVVPGARITVFCRDSSSQLFSANPFVDEVISYRDHSFFSWLSKSIKTVTTRNTVVVAALNGRRKFFISKLLFWLSRNKHRLIFNGFLDCAFWNRHTYGKIIAQGLKSDVNSPFADKLRTVLVLETADPEKMRKLLQIAAEPRVNPNAQITLFCNELRREEFNSLAEVDQIVTYSNISLWAKFISSFKLIFSYPEVVTARFSGRRDFIPLKIMFWLIRTPNRIVFNEDLDCFYLNCKTFRLLFADKNRQSETLLFEGFRVVVKIFLFLPRFVYLLSWMGFRILKHKSRVSQ